MKQKVIITVKGGVADIAYQSNNVDTIILDLDNEPITDEEIQHIINKIKQEEKYDKYINSSK